MIQCIAMREPTPDYRLREQTLVGATSNPIDTFVKQFKCSWQARKLNRFIKRLNGFKRRLKTLNQTPTVRLN